MSRFPCPVCRHLHFPKLNNICHFSDHLTNLSRLFYTFCLSPSFLTFLNTFVSSANFGTLLVILSSKSLIHILRIIKVLILIFVVHHSELISSLKPLHLLQHASFCQSAIVLPSPIRWALNLSSNHKATDTLSIAL